MSTTRFSSPGLLIVSSLGFVLSSLTVVGCSNVSLRGSGGSTTPPGPVTVPSKYITDPPNENVMQWKLDDNSSITTVAGGSVLYGFSQNGGLMGASSTAQVASTAHGFPAFHLNGPYVTIDLSTIHPYETANLWSKYSANPVISHGYPQDCEVVRNPNGPNGGDWYCFGAVAGNMDRYESTDLVHWTGQTQVLAAGSAGAWDELVQDGYAFQDPLNGGVWILLYRGYNISTGSYQVGLATSSDGTTFSRKNNGGLNDGLFPVFGANYDVQSVMLVGTTYYVYVNGSPGHNSTNVYSSTDDFNTFTAYDQNPIFVNGFCPTVWSSGGSYYMLIARDLDGGSTAPLTHGIALYRSTSPTFSRNSRQYLGYVVVNDQPYDGRYLDTPSIPTTDIYRTKYAPEFGNVLYMLYSGVHAPASAFSFTLSIAFSSLSALSSLAPIPEAVTESLSMSTPITYSTWLQFDSIAAGENIFRVGGNTPVGGPPTWFVTIMPNGSDNVLALYFNGSYALTSFPLATGTPYLVTVVDNVTNKQVYIDGALVGTFSYPLSFPYPSPSYLYIGAGDGPLPFQGYVWDFRIYLQGLSAAEVSDLYQTGSVAPVISNISASVTSSTATITWQTDSATDSQVVYGLSSTYTIASIVNSGATTTHDVLLTGLSASTKYHFAVKSSNGTLSTSPDQTFTTTASN